MNCERCQCEVEDGEKLCGFCECDDRNAARRSLASANGSADSLYGNCVVCGKYLGEADYNCQAVIAAIGPEGTVVCCVGHLFYGPRERAPGYEEAIRKIAEAKATQCGWKPPNADFRDTAK